MNCASPVSADAATEVSATATAKAERLRRIGVGVPQDLQETHGLFESAWRFAETAVNARFNAVSSANVSKASFGGSCIASTAGEADFVHVFSVPAGYDNIVQITNTPVTSAGRDIAFDIAGNVLTVSSGQGLLRVFSVGGTTTVSA